VYLKNGPAGYTSLEHRNTYLDPHDLGSFRAHYGACRASSESPNSQSSFYNSIYDLVTDRTLLDLDEHYNSLIETISQKVAHKFQYNVNCSQSLEFLNLDTWPDIYEIRQLAEYIVPQIEERVYSCLVRVETATVYRNIPFSKPVGPSSWQWHYDNCPDEYTKVLINLSNVSSDDGPMEFLSGPRRAIPKYFSSRINPEYTDISQTMFNRGDRIPTDVIDNCISSGCTVSQLTGPRGTYALFSPNQPHRATMPNTDSKAWRDVLIFQLRPALTHDSWYNEDIGLHPLGDPKVYSLD
jgi:hypothetical protein